MNLTYARLKSTKENLQHYRGFPHNKLSDHHTVADKVLQDVRKPNMFNFPAGRPDFIVACRESLDNSRFFVGDKKIGTLSTKSRPVCDGVYAAQYD